MSKADLEQTLFWHGQFADQLPFSLPGKQTRRRSRRRSRPKKVKGMIRQAQSIAAK